MTSNTPEVLARKLETMFPDKAARREIMGIPNHCGVETFEREPDRVRLDILKVAGTSAQYPDQLLAPTWNMPKEESLKIAATDCEQCQEWLNRE